jgi:thioredoxin-related protein
VRPWLCTAVIVALWCTLSGCEKQAAGPSSAAVSKSASADETPAFHAVAFEVACQQAQQDGKIVMVDFYTPRSRPCKMLERKTWRDAAVRDWLRARTVPLKIDAEKQKELAARYRVEACPTILFLKPDGNEMDRLVGFIEPDDFLKNAADIVAGVDRAQAVRDELKTAGNDPMKRHELALKFADLNKYPEALEQLLWCFDHGLEHDPAYAGVRLSFLVKNIAGLGQDYPPALAALHERRDGARQAVLDGSGTFESAAELAALNAALRENAQTLQVFDRLAKSDLPNKDQMRRAMSSDVFDSLLQARRYSDILSVTDVDEVFARHMQTYEDLSRRYGPKEQYLLRMQRHDIAEDCATLYEVLVGVHDNDAANRLAERIMDFDPSANTLQVLTLSALRAGDLDAVRAFVSSKLETLPKGQRRLVQSSLQHAADELPRVTLVYQYFDLVTRDERPEGAAALGQQVADSLNGQASPLNEFAWRVLTDEQVKFRDLELALQVAKSAYDACAGKEPEIVDTYARALWDTGSHDQALELQRKAVKLAAETGDERVLADVKATLARYEAEAGN